MVCPDIGIAHFQSSKNIGKKTFLVDCHITQVNIIHLMYGPEGNSFVFPRVLMFPETKSRETSGSRENKTVSLGTIHKVCNIPQFSYYLGQFYYYLGRDTFEFDQGQVTKNQPITVLVLLYESLANLRYSPVLAGEHSVT